MSLLEPLNNVIGQLRKEYADLPEAIGKLDDHLKEAIQKINSGQDVATTVMEMQRIVVSLKDDITIAAARTVKEVGEATSEVIDKVQDVIQNVEDNIDNAAAEAAKLLKQLEDADKEEETSEVIVNTDDSDDASDDLTVEAGDDAKE